MHLGDPMQAQPRHLLVGQMDTPISVRPTGRVAMVGARLTPSGLSCLLPIPQLQLTGRIVALDAVWNRWTRETADRVSSAGDGASALDAFERALEQLVPADVTQHCERAIAAALRAMRLRGAPIEIDAFARAAGISRRHFERRFRDRVGLSPHLFGRIVRFQHAFAALGEEPGASLAARLGYVDQAHLIREVRRFSEHTPTLLASAEGLTSFFANASRAQPVANLQS